MRLRSFPFALILLLPGFSHAERPTAPATVSTCFTPGPESCADRIVELIDGATTTIRVQAYYLTQPRILHAIAAAKKRGLDVAVILDKRSHGEWIATIALAG